MVKIVLDSYVYLHMKLFNKSDQILCAHKTHFLMLGHICGQQNLHESMTIHVTYKKTGIIVYGK